MLNNLTLKTRQKPNFCSLESKRRVRVTRSALIHASLTVGRRNGPDALIALSKQGGLADAMLRITRVFAYIDFGNPNKIQHTDTFKALDQSERAVASFFFGMAFAKLFAAKHLNYAWAVHYSLLESDGRVSRADLSKSSPDLVGFDKSNTFVGVLEAKGRSGKYDSNAMSKAKKQVRQPIFIDGKSPSKRVAGQLYLNTFDAFEYRWKDPVSDDGEPLIFKTSVDTWRHYYWPAFMLHDWISENPDGLPFDIRVKLSPVLHELKFVLEGTPSIERLNKILVQVQREARDRATSIGGSPDVFHGFDGISIAEPE